MNRDVLNDRSADQMENSKTEDHKHHQRLQNKPPWASAAFADGPARDPRSGLKLLNPRCFVAGTLINQMTVTADDIGGLLAPRFMQGAQDRPETAIMLLRHRRRAGIIVNRRVLNFLHRTPSA